MPSARDAGEAAISHPALLDPWQMPLHGGIYRTSSPRRPGQRHLERDGFRRNIVCISDVVFVLSRGEVVEEGFDPVPDGHYGSFCGNAAEVFEIGERGLF
jgi:hypothetical protein